MGGGGAKAQRKQKNQTRLNKPFAGVSNLHIHSNNDWMASVSAVSFGPVNSVSVKQLSMHGAYSSYCPQMSG